MAKEFERSVMHMDTDGIVFNGSTEHIYKRLIQRGTCAKRISDLQANCHPVSRARDWRATYCCGLHLDQELGIEKFQLPQGLAQWSTGL